MSVDKMFKIELSGDAVDPFLAFTSQIAEALMSSEVRLREIEGNLQYIVQLMEPEDSDDN